MADTATDTAPRDVTLKFDDGTSHRYAGVPKDVTPEQVRQRAVKDFPKRRLVSIDGGKKRLSPSGEPTLPFMDRTILGALDKTEEKETFLVRKYGRQAVSTRNGELVVKIKGKEVKASVGLLPSLVADAPEMTLGTAGAIAGAPAGPGGAVTGALAGGMAGKAIKETAKSVAGLQRETPGEIASSVGKAGVSMAAGEATAGIVKAPFSRLSRGPLPHWVTDSTPETRAMTERTLAGGARPPAQSTMPAAKKLQRIAILADKISGPSPTIDRANMGYLQERASNILDKAGVKGAAKDETMSRLVTTKESAMSFQDVGKLIQNDAKRMLSQLDRNSIAAGRGAAKGKDAAYLRQLAAAGKTPEDAYKWLLAPGQTDRLERFVKIVGKNSLTVEAVQQRALRHVLAGALDRTGTGEATGALTKELSEFTPKQQKMLFPGGLDNDLRLFGREVQFLYPEIKDPAMAGFTAGQIMQRNVARRLYAQGTYSIYRAVLQNPAIIRRLAIGFQGDSAQRIAARTALREMFYFGALEVSHPGLDPSTIPEPKDEKK
jgi:hypothetical protein